MAQIIDGKKISAQIREEIAAEVAQMKAEGTVPGLAVIIVGENPASKVYVRNKGKGCAEVGMYSEIIEMAEETTQAELLAKIDELNARRDIHGILVQLPLPKQIDERAVI
ncbi:MAG: bifunctional methylenetetrahydrofolate dehydrogenase/methenyltetrahydrofolate cyclohydrolase, partial [Clostridia bacterium]|nr:bifunctional methylenetetrahydrofolate dehydrogenase/methenyltetrahydrofolate cyclohydrolase [Clostridia bacterium]